MCRKMLKYRTFSRSCLQQQSITIILRAGKNSNRSSLSRFLSVQTFLCEYHISTTTIQKVVIRGLTFEMFRVGTTCQGDILPAWQTELQRETLTHDWSKAKNNTSCNAGVISKLYAYCKSQNENSGLTAHEVKDNY